MLASPVLAVLEAAEDLCMDDLVNKALVARNDLEETRCEVLGLIVNKVCVLQALPVD
jgi:hypothetical protein